MPRFVVVLKGAVLLSQKVDETPPFEDKCHNYLFVFNPNLCSIWCGCPGIEPPCVCGAQKGHVSYPVSTSSVLFAGSILKSSYLYDLNVMFSHSLLLTLMAHLLLFMKLFLMATFETAKN